MLLKNDRIWMRMGPSDGEFHAEFEKNTPGAIRGRKSMIMKVLTLYDILKSQMEIF